MLRKWKQKWRRRRLHASGVREYPGIPKKSFGSGNSAWTICPEGLDAGSVVYSFGVGTDISFDLALIEHFDLTVHAFDPTPVSVEWVRKQQLPNQFVFHPVGLAEYDGDMTFHPPRRATSSHFAPIQRYKNKPDETTITAAVERLSSIMQRLGHAQIDLLKLDIEGGEYAALEDFIPAKLSIRQLAIEFHHSYATVPLQKTLAAIALLREHDFELIHISPRTYEMTFLQRNKAVSA